MKLVMAVMVFSVVLATGFAYSQLPDQDALAKQVHEAYLTAPWFEVQTAAGARWTCIDKAEGENVDRLVGWLANRAGMVQGL